MELDTSLLLEGITGAEPHIAIKPASRVIELKCTVAPCRTTSHAVDTLSEQGTRDLLHQSVGNML